MSAMATTEVITPATEDTDTRVPFSRLVRVELRKILDTRAGMWLLLSIGALTATVLVFYLILAHKSDLTFDNALTAAVAPQTLLLPVLGALAITSEWSQRTGLVSFTLEPSRGRIVGAKAVALVILGLGVVVVGYVLAAVANLVGLGIRGQGDWNYHVGWGVNVVLGQILTVLEGFGLGMLLMSSAAAIVVYYMARVVFPILLGVIPGLQHVAPWIDLNTPLGNLFGHQLSGDGWLQLAITVAIWVGVPTTVGFYRLKRSEVK
jgi:ABC-2 type transport system permease protein